MNDTSCFPYNLVCVAATLLLVENVFPVRNGLINQGVSEKLLKIIFGIIFYQTRLSNIAIIIQCPGKHPI